MKFGFQLSSSTEHAIPQLINDISSCLGKEHTQEIFTDLSKAFDTVDHKLLIFKWEHYGIKGKNLKWPKSYQSE